MPLEWLKQAGQEWTDQGQNAPVSEDQSSPPTPTPAGNSDSSDGGIRSVFKDWTAQENEPQVEAPAVQPTKLPDQVVLKPVRTGDAKTLPLPDPNKPDTQQDSNGDPVIGSPINVVGEEDKNKLDLTERLPSYEKFKSLNPTPQELNVYKHHSDNFLSQNGGKPSYSKEGDIETVRLATFENEGNVYAIPTQWNGKVLPFKEAVEKAKVGGLDQWPHLPVGNDPQAAEKALNDRYINDIHPIFDLDVNQREKQLREEDVVTPSGKVRLIMDEGERLSPYKDSQKIRTIGVGFNLEDPDNAELFKEVTGHDPAKADITITKTQSRQLLEKTVSRAENDAKDVFSNFDQLPSTVKDALTNFTFNLGQTKASEFKKTIAAVKAGDGVKAAQQLRQSLWYKQVGARAERIAKIIESDLKPESTDEVYRDEHGNDFTLNSDGTLVPHK